MPWNNKHSDRHFKASYYKFYPWLKGINLKGKKEKGAVFKASWRNSYMHEEEIKD